MEIWDLYTEDRVITGKTHIRGEELPDDLYHLVVHVWIRNKDGKYLISQRSANRPSFPLMWECVGGSVIQGEDSKQGAIRETMEEVGIDLSDCNGSIVFSKVRKIIDGKKFNDILDVWLFEYDGKFMLSNSTTDEVKQSKWLDVSQIRDLYKNGDLVATLGYFFEDIAS